MYNDVIIHKIAFFAKGTKMKFTKYDWIQLFFNICLITATVLNALYLMGIAERWLTTVGLVLALVGCVVTNLTATGDKNGMRTEVSGSKALATLTYITGILWVLSYAMSLFINIDMNLNAGG